MSCCPCRWFAFLLFLVGGWVGRETATAQVLPQVLQFGGAGEHDGLPSNEIHCLLHDHQGFLWIGTADGLTRYDGTSFRIWRHRRDDPHSLGHNTVLSLAEDARGRIWVGTHGGVSCLDVARETFRTWHHDDHDTTSLSVDYDDRVLVTRDGTVWVGNGAGLNRYDARHDCWVRLRLPGDNGLVSAMLEDRTGRLWLGSNGLIRAFQPRTGRVVAALPLYQYPGQLPSPITAFLEDHEGQLWATTWGSGLLRLDVAMGRSRQLWWEPVGAASGLANIGLSLAETHDATGRYSLWIGSSYGLLRLDQPRPGAAYPDTLRDVLRYRHRPDNRASIPMGDVTALLTDPAGTLWLGTGGGLGWLVPAQQAVQLMAFDDDRQHMYPSRMLAERDPHTRQLRYWMTSWYADGLALYDSAWNRLRSWPRLPVGSPEFDAGQMGTLVRSRVDGRLWIATYNGLVRFDPTTGRTRVYRGAPTDSTGLRDYHLTHAFEDRYGRLWVAAWRRGIYLLEDRERGRFRHFPGAAGPGKPGLPFNTTSAFCEDAAGRLWIAGEGGLVRLDPAVPGGWRTYLADPADPHALPNARINDLWPTPDGRLWVATEDGVAIWHPETDRFELLTSLQGLPCDLVYSIRTDRLGQLWFTTPRGLVRALGSRGPFRLVGLPASLPQSDLSGRFDTLADGRLAVGLPGALLLLDPLALVRNQRPPPVVITEVRLFDELLHLGRSLDSVPLLDLTPAQNTLTFGYTALNYTNAGRNRYFYHLDGIDRDWVSAGARRYATYANLPGGTYVFRVRATNDDGTPSQRDAVFRFHVQPPFTRTWVFWGGLTLLVVGGVGARVRQIRREADRQTRLSREMAELELTALRAQMNPHFVFNALNAIQQCVLTGRTDAAGRYLARFARLLRLVLEHSERTYVPLDAELESLRLYLDLEGLRLDGLQVVIDVDPELEDSPPRIPTMILQPYLENALWHGLAPQSPEHRHLRLTLAYTPDETAVHAVIEDSGIGRAASAARRSPGRAHRSMGLRLTERRLQLLGGGITPVQVTDLTTATGQAAGTRVEVWLRAE